MLLVLLLFGLTGVLAALGIFAWPVGLLATGVFSALVIDRFIAGVQAYRRFHHRAAWFLVPVHLIRDLAWAGAILVWSGKSWLLPGEFIFEQKNSCFVGQMED